MAILKVMILLLLLGKCQLRCGDHWVRVLGYSHKGGRWRETVVVEVLEVQIAAQFRSPQVDRRR